ncbi:MAG: hypothetical protein Rubg2KO_04780 [Rubricoccaceae bacterium]
MEHRNADRSAAATNPDVEHARHVRDLFDEVADLAPPTRDARLDAVQRSDAALVRDVRQLLTADDHADRVLQRLDGAPNTHPYGPGALEVGQTVSHYRVVGRLGSGGMGVVYRAEDTRLHRPVALKFLPPDLTRDPEARERLLREARAAGALDHPHLCTVHDVGETGAGEVFIAMACYEGETLRDRIARGPLPVGEAVEIAAQIAGGLAAAHEAGLVHRDVKPANVMVTASGAKLLDFGLATLDGGATDGGARWGTVAYMSPEQARGEKGDHRTDVWSFGVLLYEMLTGEKPFDAGHGQPVGHRTRLEPSNPSLASRPDIPPSLVRVVENTLARDPAERYADMGAVLANLRVVQRGRRGAPAGRVARPLRWTVAGGVAALALLSVLSMRPGDPEPPAPASHQRVTSVGAAFLPEVSPDGQAVAYIERVSETEQRVMIQDVAGGDPVVVLDPCYDCWNLRWVPDGSALSFSAYLGPGLGGPTNVVAPRSGGELRRLDPYTDNFSWSPDGSQYAGSGTSDRDIVFVDRATGEVVDRIELEVPFAWLYGVEWSPRGDRLLFLTYDDDMQFSVWTVGLDGREVQRVVEAPKAVFSPRWAADGEGIYYLMREGDAESVMWVPVDPQSGAAAGAPEPVLVGLETDDSFSLSGDGTRLAYARASISSHLWALTPANAGAGTPSAKALTTGTSWNECPSVSPDGRHVAFRRRAADAAANVFVMPVAGGPPRQVTHREGENRCPVWSPDGQTLAFASDEDGAFGLWSVGVEDGTLRSFAQARMGRAEVAWAPMAHVLYRRLEDGAVYAVDPETGNETLFPADTSRARREASRFRFTTAGQLVNLREPTLATDLRPIGQSTDGDWVYALERGARDARIVRVHATTGERRLVTEVPEEIRVGLRNAHPNVTMTPDGTWFVFAVRQGHASDVVLVDDFDTARR